MKFQERAPGCDAPDPAPLYYNVDENGKLTTVCRCTVCSRCGHHTGNTNQGHWWRLCSVTGKLREFHFCCPSDCELEESSAP